LSSAAAKAGDALQTMATKATARIERPVGDKK
jgi:hypothetical protein